MVKSNVLKTLSSHQTVDDEDWVEPGPSIVHSDQIIIKSTWHYNCIINTSELKIYFKIIKGQR